MNRELLLKLIESDELDLLKIKFPSSILQNSNERLLAVFQEINDFINETGREPQPNKEDGMEFALYCQLTSFRENLEHIQLLLQHDKFKLLNTKKIINSIEDIFENDDLGLLNDWLDDIFDIKHVPHEIASSDYVAQRKVCQNFQEYEQFFKQCHLDLISGKRKLISFAREQQIDKGDFFILKGILTYVASVGEKEIRKGKRDARLHCVFENGTESDMLLRSLARELYRNGRRVTIHEDRLLEGFNAVTDKDSETGWIYILKSQSTHPEIQSLKDLYKIGFTRTPVEDRIRNAEQETTYLMAPVSLIATYQCYNLKPQNLEYNIHTFFNAVCLNIAISDKDGRPHLPREWFIAPIHVIDQAIGHLLRDDIMYYQYDHKRQEIVERK